MTIHDTSTVLSWRKRHRETQREDVFRTPLGIQNTNRRDVEMFRTQVPFHQWRVKNNRFSVFRRTGGRVIEMIARPHHDRISLWTENRNTANTVLCSHSLCFLYSAVTTIAAQGVVYKSAMRPILSICNNYVHIVCACMFSLKTRLTSSCRVLSEKYAFPNGIFKS